MAAPPKTRLRVVVVAAVAAPVLAGGPFLDDDGVPYRPEELIGYIGGWTVYAWIAIGLAALDLRDANSRGRLAFVAGATASLLALALSYAGGYLVAPALALILVAASIRPAGGWYGVRLIVSALLVVLSWVVYGSALFSSDASASSGTASKSSRVGIIPTLLDFAPAIACPSLRRPAR